MEETSGQASSTKMSEMQFERGRCGRGVQSVGKAVRREAEVEVSSVGHGCPGRGT